MLFKLAKVVSRFTWSHSWLCPFKLEKVGLTFFQFQSISAHPIEQFQWFNIVLNNWIVPLFLEFNDAKTRYSFTKRLQLAWNSTFNCLIYNCLLLSVQFIVWQNLSLLFTVIALEELWLEVMERGVCGNEWP